MIWICVHVCACVHQTPCDGIAHQFESTEFIVDLVVLYLLWWLFDTKLELKWVHRWHTCINNLFTWVYSGKKTLPHASYCVKAPFETFCMKYIQEAKSKNKWLQFRLSQYTKICWCFFFVVQTCLQAMLLSALFIFTRTHTQTWTSSIYVWRWACKALTLW